MAKKAGAEPMSDINVVLAESPGTGAVRLCGCNCVLLSVGPIVIKMVPEMFAWTALMMKQAMECLTDIATAGEIKRTQKPN
jgi:hypothetical protein